MAESQVVVFELAGVRYGIDIKEVQEIMRMVEVTPLANTDPGLEGIINIRGQIIRVINLSRKLCLPETEISPETRIIVAGHGEERTGLIVDRVLEVGTYTSDEVEDPSVIGSDAEFILFIIKKREQLWLVLNLSQVA